jgi:CRP-like cAMP-binding protein
MPRGHPAFDLFVRKLSQRSILTEEERQAILSLNGREVEIEPHRDIVGPGQVTDTSCFVVSGLAARFGQLRDGRRQITAIHIPGDMCDLYSLMLPKVEWALQALSARLTIVKVPHRDLAALCRDHPGIAEAFWRDCVADGSILSQWVVNIGRRDARMRAAHLFCELGVRMEKAGLGERTRYRLPVVQALLADVLGMTPVHMNRVIRSMREEGLMTIVGREIHVPDWAALATAAGFEEGYLELTQAARRL